LITEICGGVVSSPITDVYPNPVKEKEITLTWEKLDRIAGISINQEQAKEILSSLSFRYLLPTPLQSPLLAPTFKTDVMRSEDVIEEVLRINGYDKILIPASLRSSIGEGGENKKELLYEEVSQLLASVGFREMMNNSISNSIITTSFLPKERSRLVRLLSYSNVGLDSLRSSMLFPALEVVAYNHNRRQMDLKLFELGKTYKKAGEKYLEASKAHYSYYRLCAGRVVERRAATVDIYYLKGVVEAVLKKSSIRNYVTAAGNNNLLLEELTYAVAKDDTRHYGKSTS
jgi:phenylalanyl-tRNA synthetase beta chain